MAFCSAKHMLPFRLKIQKMDPPPHGKNTCFIVGSKCSVVSYQKRFEL